MQRRSQGRLCCFRVIDSFYVIAIENDNAIPSEVISGMLSLLSPTTTPAKYFSTGVYAVAYVQKQN